MNALRDLQQRCYDAFVLDDEAALRGELAGAGVVASVGRYVYRNNVIESTLKTLSACYPVVLRLVGHDCMRTLGRDYRVRFPSISGNLDEFGESFPRFLARFYADSPYVYLADVARLEWAISRLVDQPGAAPVSLDCLTEIEPARFACLRWQLDPELAIVRSDYPVYRIWAVNMAEDDETIVDLNAGGESVLIAPGGRRPHIHRISQACAEFLGALRNGLTMGEACDVALTADPAFDLAETLGLLVRTGAVAAIIGPEFQTSRYTTSTN